MHWKFTVESFYYLTTNSPKCHTIPLRLSKYGLKFFIFFSDTREKNEAFGSSLLLANSPMSPKIVNGSFAAIFDADEFLAKTYAGIRIAVIISLYITLISSEFCAWLLWIFFFNFKNFVFSSIPESKLTGDASTSSRNFDVR